MAPESLEAPAQLPRFKHDSLDTSKQQIRLLEILYESNGRLKGCKLQQYTLDEACPPYRALSYTWGDKLSKTDILVNGRALTITRNLHRFFQEFVHHVEFRGLFFIDQICINQEDLQERNHQVQLMKRIFSGALCVLVWLDSQDQIVKSVTPLLNHLQWCIVECDADNLDWAILSNEVGQEQLLDSFFSSGYFSRIWIAQEIVLADKVYILCGRQTFSWRIFEYVERELQSWMAKDLDTPKNFPLAHTPCMALVGLRRDYRSTGISLNWLLRSFGNSQCSIDLDHVYGMLGMIEARPSHADLLQIDYAKSSYQLFVDVALYMLSDKRTEWKDAGLYGLSSGLKIDCKTGHVVKKANEKLQQGDVSREDIVQWICESTKHPWWAPPCQPGACSLATCTDEPSMKDKLDKNSKILFKKWFAREKPQSELSFRY